MSNPWITRYMKDLDRLKTIQAVIDRDMKPGIAAQRLGMSVRQIERLVIRYRADGPVALISRHRHRTGNRALKAPLAERIIGILREQYSDFGPAGPYPIRAGHVARGGCVTGGDVRSKYLARRRTLE